MKLKKLITVFATVLAFGVALFAAPGKICVNEVSGNVVYTVAGGAEKKLAAGATFLENTRVSTGKDASAKIALGNGTVIVLQENTSIDLAQFEQNDPSAVEGKDFSSFKEEPKGTAGSQTTLRLVKGTAFFKVAKLLPSSRLVVKTRAGDVAVKGTTFYTSVDNASVAVGCIDGEIEVTPTGRAGISLTAGRSISINSAGQLKFERVSGILSRQVTDAFASDSGDFGENYDNDRISKFATDPLYFYTATVEGDSYNVDRPRPDVNSAASVGNR